MEQGIENNKPYGADDEIDVKDYLFYFVAHWRTFALSLGVCLLLAIIYLYRTMPVYQVSATIMVRDEKRGGDFLTELSVFDGINAMNNSNTDNEVEVLRSKTLIKDVICTYQLYKSYIGKKHFSSVDLFDKSPIYVVDSLFDVHSLKSSYVIELDVKSEDEFLVTLTSKKEVLLDSTFTQFPIKLMTPKGLLELNCSNITDLQEYGEYEIAVIPPITLAREYLKDLKVTTASKNSSVVNLKFNTTNEERGVLFLDALISQYNESAVEEKNEVAAKTAEFIDERVSMLSADLGSTEKDLEKYKKKEGLTDLPSNAQLYVSQGAEYEQKRVENETQLNLVTSLKNYLSKDENKEMVIPANFGLTDAELVNQIELYNKMLMDRNRLMRSTSDHNPVVMQQTAQIESMYENIRLLVKKNEDGLKIMQNNLEKQYNKYRGLIYNIPTQERLSVEIERQRQIQQQLFLMLLQKREENALAMAATVNKAKYIEECLAEPLPIFPKKSLVILVAVILALLCASVIVVLKKYFNLNISNSLDIEKEKLSHLPVLVDLPMFKLDSKQEILSGQKVEVFRHLRTNVQFMLKHESHKVILFTSFVPNEGKTFISANMAISFASLGKKVVVVGADIRNPELTNFFGENSKNGLSNYLSSSKITIESLIKTTSYDNLDFITAGPVPPNSTELLSLPRWDDLISELKKKYDYVLIDSAPVAIVSDTLVLGRVADLTLFVFRANSSNKNWFREINKLAETNRLKNVALAINCVESKAKFAYGKKGYGYGYGYNYGYGYGYGYGHKNKS